MDLRSVFGTNGDDDDSVLPQPTAEMRFADDDGSFTEEQVRGLLCNPVYAGIGPYPPLVDEATWVRAAVKLIDEDGPEQFLVNLLSLLRQSFQQAKLDFQ